MKRSPVLCLLFISAACVGACGGSVASSAASSSTSGAGVGGGGGVCAPSTTSGVGGGGGICEPSSSAGGGGKVDCDPDGLAATTPIGESYPAGAVCSMKNCEPGETGFVCGEDVYCPAPLAMCEPGRGPQVCGHGIAGDVNRCNATAWCCVPAPAATAAHPAEYAKIDGKPRRAISRTW